MVCDGSSHGLRRSTLVGLLHECAAYPLTLPGDRTVASISSCIQKWTDMPTLSTERPGSIHRPVQGRRDRPLIAVGRALNSPTIWLLRLTGDRWPALSRTHDRYIIGRRMRRALGYVPNLDLPRTYNEKLGWRMLYDRNPLLPLTTDKVAVRDYVAAKVGPEILVPLLGVYERASDIPWQSLPSAFVLKASHGCGLNIIVRDKAVANEDAIRRTAATWLRHNHYEASREWAYREIQPRLIIEELLLDENNQVPIDLKFLVFHGKTAMIRVHIDRFGEHRVNFYDPQLRLLPVRQDYPVDESYALPTAVASMASIAEKLAEDFDYARIDLYLVGGQVRFGEVTHYDGAAAQPFRPGDIDGQLGALWRIPEAAASVSPRRATRNQ